jgi:pyridoxamine 5'-phosphate oxidase
MAIEDARLIEAEVDAHPMVQFRHWYQDAADRDVLQPEAMVVATATPDGRPSARAVLLRVLDERGFGFFTNYESRKGRELAANPRAAILFHWPAVQRQVRATGRVERVTEAESEAYWQSRPRASRLGAWASAQSEPIASRAALEAKAAEVEARFADAGDDVPLPPFWGGYRVVPDEVEFWQHGEDRLHDRLRYTLSDSGTWAIERLQP